MDRLGVAHRAGHYPSQLSGGEQQRVAYCRAVLNAPPLVLADEPTGTLDEGHAAVILSELRGLCRDRGASVILVTHRADAAALADRTLSLRAGRLEPRGGGTTCSRVARSRPCSCWAGCWRGPERRLPMTPAAPSPLRPTGSSPVPPRCSRAWAGTSTRRTATWAGSSPIPAVSTATTSGSTPRVSSTGRAWPSGDSTGGD